MLVLYLVDRRFRAHVAQAPSMSQFKCVGTAVLTILYATSSIYILGKTLGLKQIWRRCIFLKLQDDKKTAMCGPTKGMGETIWLSCMLDCWAKHMIFAVKALVAASPFVHREFTNNATSLAQKRKLYALIEAAGHCYRTLLPCAGWLEYYQSVGSYLKERHGMFSFTVSIVSACYLGIKYIHFIFLSKKVLDGICFHCNGNAMVEFGRLATDDDLCDVSECCICNEAVRKPAIVLECSHIFCEDCLQEWLDRENTCPLCRRQTRSLNPVPACYRDGHTSLLPFFW